MTTTETFSPGLHQGPIIPPSVVEPAELERVQDQPRPIAKRTVDDILSLGGSLAASLALVWVLYTQILPFSGILGFLIGWFAVFLWLYAGVLSLAHPRQIVIDRLMSAIVTTAALIIGFALVTVIVYTVVQGAPALPHSNFYFHDMAGVGPQAPLNQGGIEHAIVGSLIELAIAVVISLPLGLATSVFMTEVGGPMARVVRTVVEAMTAIPDLLAGLFIYVTLIVGFNFPRTGFTAAIALAVTMTPIIARSAEVALRIVPGGLREAGQALGASQWQTVWRVVLPTARPGLATSLILSMARGIGETAPLLIVSGASTFFNDNPFKNPMNSLPLFIFSGVRSGEPLYITRAFGAAVVLLAIVLLLFIVTRLLARQKVGNR